jgi:hypothetical protein
MKNISLFLLAGAISLFGCKKETSTEFSNSYLTYQLATTNAATVSGTGRDMGSFLEWTSGTATVADIRFETKGANTMEYKSPVPQTIELLSALPTLGHITIPYGTYEKVEFKIGFVPAAGGSSLELRGSYTPTGGGTAIPVVLRFHEPFELMYEKTTPTTIDFNADYTALSTLALGLLTEGMEESWLAGAQQTNGTIVISQTANTNLYSTLWDLFQDILKVELKKK